MLPGGWLFPGQNPVTPLTTRQLRRAFHGAKEAAGISLVATMVGAVAFVITLPFSALGGNVDEAGEKLVVRPAAYTFSRCLGCFGGEH